MPASNLHARVAREARLMHLPDAQDRVRRAQQAARRIEREAQRRNGVAGDAREVGERALRRAVAVGGAMGLVERPFEARDVGQVREIARVRIRREKVAERAAVHVEVPARGRVRVRVRVDRSVEERRAGELADHAVRRAERVAIVRPHGVAVERRRARHPRRRPRRSPRRTGAAGHAATASHVSRMACAVAASPASTANSGMSVSHSISVGTRPNRASAAR